jgi:hypothetical protein
MIIPKWLLPLISIVAALAVGVAATLIGMQFASHQVHATPSKTVTAPVFAPVEPGQKLSSVVGQYTGALPGTSGSPISGSRQQLIHDVLHSADPAATIRDETTGDGADSSPSGTPGADSSPSTGTTGDDCSPSSGEPPAGCPSGIHGAVFASHMIPPFWMNVLAFPQASGVSSSTPRCAADTTPGHVTIGVASDMPADFTVTYWPTGDTADREVAQVSTDETQVAAFNAYYGGDGTGLSPVMYSCTVLTVTPGTGYTAQVGATDSVGRLATPVSLVFNGTGAPAHPELEAHTVGSNLLFASALHAPDETVQIKGVQRTAGAADCNGSDVLTAWEAPTETAVGPDYLNDHQILPADNARTSYAFFVPEGLDFLLCARWFPAGHATSWERSTPSYESRQSMSSPDKLLPSVTLTALTAASSTDSVDISTSTGGGIACSNASWRRSAGSGGGIALPLPICSTNSYGGARHDGSRYWDLGDDDTVYVRFTVNTGDQPDIAHPDGFFRLTTACAGDCSVPTPRTYTTSLLDGSSRATDGSVSITVSYTQGNHNGAADWVTGSVDGVIPEHPTPSAPTFDTDAVAAPGPIVGNLASSVTIRIASDRPVDYSVRAYEADGSATTCLRSGAGAVTGHLEADGDVYLGGLCLGVVYGLEITLTDRDGHRSIWGALGTDPNGWWPGNSIFTTPSVTGTIRYDFRAYGPSPSKISLLSVDFGDVILGASDPLNNSCHPNGIFNAQGSVPGVHLGQNLVLYVRFAVRQSDSGDAGCHPLAHQPSQTANASVELQLDQLDGSYDGVVVNSETGTPLWNIHMWFDQVPSS